MSMHNLSKDGEFRYIVQWFNEWSELQRDDFVPVLVEYLTAVENAVEVSSNNNALCMNGLVDAVSQSSIQDRPMSLFQCRIKLFREWSPQWPLDFKQKLQQKIIELDTKVGEKIINELKTTTATTTNSVQANGFATAAENDVASDCCETEEDEMTNASAVMHAAQSIVAATEAAIQTDARLVSSELLNQETISTTVNATPVAIAVDTDDVVNDNDAMLVAAAPTTTTTNDTTMQAELAEPVQLPTTAEHVATTTLATAIPI